MISLPCPKPMITIRTYQDNGPYFPPTKGSYQASRISQALFHIRQAMADHEDIIAVYKGERCVGMWHKNIEGHVDSAGDSIVDHEGYELLRPDTKEQWMWNHSQQLVT